MYCENCGAKLLEDAMFCSECGSAIHKNDGHVYENKNIVNDNKVEIHRNDMMDKQSFWLNAIAFISPIIGYIMWFCMKNKTPNRAKGCATWATIAFVINLISMFFL